jgi:chromosome partition protein MukB
VSGRARATALALVNWKGVFYERYLLDRHVTALEGANGSGKTTVMIAAYVVLLPDLTRLRFTNLGESGASGGDRGIWGRLGEANRPSYAALEYELPSGERLLAGVHLERKAEPTLALSPFLISGLQLRGNLRELLLLSDGEHDQVPELSELRETAKRLGGKFELCASSKDYFAALFELGVLPLRLGSDEERNKLNEMLRTSMTGGISRALTSELRGFLLKEETGLSSTLSRMRANLDACHRTRLEVSEARRLEHEINGIFDAGLGMFAAAVWASQKTREEATLSVERARARRQEPIAALTELEASVGETQARKASIEERVAEARRAHERAGERLAHIVRALELSRQLGELSSELSQVSERLGRARLDSDEKSARRREQKTARDAAREAYDRAAHGLGHVQSGLTELHRNAHAHRNLVEQLATARNVLNEPDFSAENAEIRRAELASRRRDLDAERARLDREAEIASTRRLEYQRALAAVERLTGPLEPAQAYARARRELERLERLESTKGRLPELSAERTRVSELAERQRSVRSRAQQFALEAGAGLIALEVERKLADAEGELRAAELEARSHDASIGLAQREAETLRKRANELALRAARWSELTTILSRLGGELEAGRHTRATVATARTRLLGEREQLLLEGAELEARRERARVEAAALISETGGLKAELLELRDELDAELFVNYFDELGTSEAAELEARLGPLAQALVVSDLGAAAEQVAKRPREMPSIWLLAPGTKPTATDRAYKQGNSLVVEENDGALRITQIPARPTLGRKARERRAGELRNEVESLGRELELLRSRQQRLDAQLRDADSAFERADLLDAGDPSQALALCHSELARAEARESSAHAAAAAAQGRAAELRPRVSGLRALLAEAYLLDAQDYAEELERLERALDEAVGAAAELERTAEVRALLGELADALRTPPLPEASQAELGDRLKRLDSERDRLFLGISALDEVSRYRHALAYAGAEQALAEKNAVLPALMAQHHAARALAEAEEAALTAREAEWEASVSARQQVEAESHALEAHAARLQAELAAEGVLDVSESALGAAQLDSSQREAEWTSLDQEARSLGTELALREERRTQFRRLVDSANAELLSCEREAEPMENAWQGFCSQAEAAGLLRGAFSTRFTELFSRQTGLHLWSEAQAKCSLLLDRLDAARGGAEEAASIRARLSERSSRSAELYLGLWQHLRAWLTSRLPAQVADVADPLEALAQLRDDLTLLEQRLGRQEGDLRGASEDVARSIEVQLRRAKGQVRRLNQNLEGIRFGSISGIRVQIRRVERMDQVLTALREGSAQSLLFQSALPIEEALDEIFKRYAGGRGGGQRILDYREYAELVVEIQRQTDSSWEPASPTRLSTGEAIGVGAALMMVILTEWERDGNLLRGKREGGSLRFLFLDEANRLSQDNLGVLFDLCQNLDLQLLIAAPEVAKAQGNTTYRLIRRITDDGREEVLVSGRRARVERDPDQETDATQVPSDAKAPEPGQLQLL